MPIGNLFGKLKDGLRKTRDGLSGTIQQVTRRGALGEEEAEALEEALLRADVGLETTETLVAAVRRASGEGESWAREALRAEIARILAGPSSDPPSVGAPPRVILVVGVNGTGKTTTVGKLAARLREEGQRVVLVAADTFRAAANEQLALWAERAGVEIVESRSGADPASVAFDGVSAGRARGADVVIVDTAGRLHSKAGLMQEIAKIHRVVGKAHEGAPHEAWLVLDATTGQNAVAQAREFAKGFPLTGLVLTKIDGTAKGGVVVSIADTLGLPVRYLGVGEAIDDLVAFDPEAFADALTSDA